MDILQIGPENWAKKYSVPSAIKWHFNSFPADRKKKSSITAYAAVIVTGANKMKADDWRQLQWATAPYTVLYWPAIENNLSVAARLFLHKQAARQIHTSPQSLINHLLSHFFVGQSGIRYFPTDLLITNHKIKQYEYLDAGHLKISLDTDGKWVSVGSYRSGLYLDPQRVFKIWLSLKTLNLKIRLRLYPAQAGTDGSISDFEVVNIDPRKKEENYLKIAPSQKVRIAAVSLEAKGNGAFILGTLHWRWWRGGNGSFMVGGHRIVDEVNHDDIAYYLNPGDMKPPLNVYFSGARGLEGFEAYPLFRRLHAPSLLFTDMRLSIGEFYDDASQQLGQKIKAVIKAALHKFGFTRQQLVMNGISMGTYPSLKYGAQLRAHAIIVAKPITNLGYVASRQRLQRPDEFDTIFDIDNQFIDHLDTQNLQALDRRFWQQFEQNDLSKTRLFIGYMKNDDYDNHAVADLRQSKAISKAEQVVYKGYPGRHNDNDAVIDWFIERVHQLLRTDFGRKL